MQLDRFAPSIADLYHGVAQDIGTARRPSPAATGRSADTPVREIMTTNVITLSQSTPVEAATELMLERKISGAPVLDEGGKPIGIVSKTDLLEAWYEHERAKGRGDVERSARGPRGVVVGDIMVPYLLAAQDSSPIALAAALMAYEGVHRLLVLNDQQQMVGIISTLDVLRWLAQLSGFCVPATPP